jgi:hypothetical protein
LFGRWTSLRAAVPEATPRGGFTAAWAETWRARPRAKAVEITILPNMMLTSELILEIVEKGVHRTDGMDEALPKRRR